MGGSALADCKEVRMHVTNSLFTFFPSLSPSSGLFFITPFHPYSLPSFYSLRSLVQCRLRRHPLPHIFAFAPGHQQCLGQRNGCCNSVLSGQGPVLCAHTASPFILCQGGSSKHLTPQGPLVVAPCPLPIANADHALCGSTGKHNPWLPSPSSISLHLNKTF